MSEIDSIINEIEKMYEVEIPNELFDSAEIYTTEDYKQRFEEKWGYSISATGAIIERPGWDKLKPIIDIASYSSARAFLPFDFKELKYGFALIAKNEQHPRWGLDHEMLHFAMCEHATEYDSIRREYLGTDNPSHQLELQNIEAEFLSEICAMRDNLEVGKGLEWMTWDWVRDNLVQSYLPYKLNSSRTPCAQYYDYYSNVISQIITIMPILQEKLEPKEITKIIFEQPFENPFKEFMTAISQYR